MNSSPSSPSDTGHGHGTDDTPYLAEWGFTLRDLYLLAVSFFKEKEGKAVHFSYEERLRLIALTCQVSHGKFDPTTSKPLGVLDVIGKDRRLAWQAVGDKNKADCMFEFIEILNKSCPLFKPFVEAHKRDIEEKGRVQRETEELSKQKQEEYQIAKEIQRRDDEEKYRQVEQKRRLQDALNSQTFEQFKAYAEQQFPQNPDQQGVLIRQLQEQHYEQYMRQLHQQELYQNEIQFKNGDGKNDPTTMKQNVQQEDSDLAQRLTQVDLNSSPDKDQKDFNNEGELGGSGGEHDGANEGGENTGISSASMWTRKDILEFKDSVKKEGGEAIIKVNQGESVTVRVPTHDDGTCLFWEFATDSYDIGFGLFFEWTDVDEPVSVHVTEENSSEDDEDDEVLTALKEDVEKGRECLPKGAKQNTDVIIPVYRRDSQNEVYVGSHMFPGKGVYLLKFDNSYSFWRSKTLYYRVYYTK